MGAGKTTTAGAVARALDRPLVDVDDEIERRTGPISDFFARYGEPAFREVETTTIAGVLDTASPHVLALGGGAVTSGDVRELLGARAFTVLLDVDVETAWQRVCGSDRPLAQDEAEFRRLYEERRPLYEETADARARDADDVVLAAGGVHVELGALDRLARLVPGDRQTALVTDPHVGGIHGADAQLALGSRLASMHEVPAGESAKTVAVCERLWQELSLDRRGTLVALGGGCTTDVAGFVAAAYLRGIGWAAVPTTLVGQVDAAIGGKTAIDLPHGKNLVGAFHWPVRTIIDPALLTTLPEHERLNGLAEVVKTGLLAGEPLWELPEAELIRRCAAYKTAVCLRDPRERGERAVLNLGHTFAHALEAAADFELPHGRAVALGLRAALRLSGQPTDAVDELLRPQPVRVDRERAWAALKRDKKGEDGRVRLVLLREPGNPEYGVDVPEEDVRRELNALIAG